MKLSASLSTHPVSFDAVPFKEHFHENAETIKTLGFDGIELAMRNPLIVDQFDVIETVKHIGLEIPAVSTGQAWSEDRLSMTDEDEAVRKAAVERVYSHIQFAEKVGAVVVIGLIRGIVAPGADRDAAAQQMIDALRLCCVRGEEHGVRIALEPLNRYETTLVNTVRQGLEVIEQIGCGNIGLLLDTFHMNIEEPCFEESIALAGKKIYHVHYADSNRLPPGGGHLDFPHILSSLKKAGYTGYLSAEHAAEDVQAVRRGFWHMKKSMQ